MNQVYVLTSEVGLTPVVFTSLKKAVKRVVETYMTEHEKALLNDPYNFVYCEVKSKKHFNGKDCSSFKFQLTLIRNFNEEILFSF